MDERDEIVSLSSTGRRRLSAAQASQAQASQGPADRPFAEPFAAPLAESGGHFVGTGDSLGLADKLAYLVSYGEMFIVVTGAAGQGKSLLKTELIAALGTQFPMLELPIAQRDEAQLLGALAEGFSLTSTSKTPLPNSDRFREFTDSLKASHRRAVLVLDDAHWLKNPALDTVFKVAEKAGLMLVLFAQPAILRHAALKTHSANLYHCDLPKLTANEMASYLRRHTPQASASLDADQMHRLLAQAEGVTGAMDQQLDEALDMPQPVRRYPIMPIVGALLVTTAALAWLVMTHYEDQPAVATQPVPVSPGDLEASVSPQSPANKPAASSLSAPMASSKVIEAADNTPVDTMPVDTMPVDTMPVNTRQRPVADKPPEAAPDRVPASAPTSVTDPDVNPVNAPAAAPVTTVATAESVASVAEVEPSAADSTAPAVAPKGINDWIYAAAPGEYTLQLMGTGSESGVVDFINRQTAPVAFSYFRTLRGSEPWYVLTAGRYPSREAALAAIESLPPQLRDRRPWARSVASILGALDNQE